MPELTLEQALESIRARLNATTPGPWDVRLGSGNNVCTSVASEAKEVFGEFVCDVLPDYICKPGQSPRWEANRDFIVAVRTDVEYLLATIERMALVVVVSEAWRHGYIDDDELVAAIDTYREQRGKGE